MDNDKLEKVIKGLECCCATEMNRCEQNTCPYWVSEICCIDEVMADALALLKEQEAVEPKTEPSAKGYWYTCGSCGWWLFQVCDTVHFDDRKRIRFCSSCGKAVKWE